MQTTTNKSETVLIKEVRSKRALINITANILNEIAHIVSAFILPRLILVTYGSGYNGVVASVTQFISYVSLLRAGLTGPTMAALYKSLAKNDFRSISGIILATAGFMRKIALLYSGMLLLLGVLYPFAVIEDFDWFFSFSMVLIIGAGTAIQYYFGITHQILIEADQKRYVITGINILTTILNIALSVIAINSGAGIHLVKLISVIVFALNPIFIYRYSKRHYRLIRDVEPDYSAIKQRWDAFAQNLAGFIDKNTDIVIATIFLNIYEVSVYSMYYLVIRSIQRMVMTIISGLGPFFGNMLAEGEDILIKENTRIFEGVTFSLSTFVFSVAVLQITPFVSVYTRGVTDIDYYRPIFGYIACAASYLQCIRTPYVTITASAGHFRPLRNGAIIEAVANIVLSLILVNFLGIIGLVIGTFVARISRIFRYSSYMYKNIINMRYSEFIGRFALSLFSIGIISVASPFLGLKYPDDFYTWIVNSCILSALSISVTFGINFAFYKDEMFALYNKTMGALTKLQ